MVEIFLNRVATTPVLVAMRSNSGGRWNPITFREFGRQAQEVANGLISLGIEKGERVSLLSRNCPEWYICDMGIMLAGGCTVPVYVTNSPPQVAHVLGHSRSRVALVENGEQLEKIRECRSELPDLKSVVVFTGEGADEEERILSLDALRRLGSSYEREHPQEVQERAGAVAPEDLATIVYTSGTTGMPKGAMLTHANAVWTVQSAMKVLDLREGMERLVCYLPLSHIFERLASEWGGIYQGMEVWFSETIDRLRPTLEECCPTFFVGVPRVYEKFAAGLKAHIREHPKRKLIEKAIGIGTRKAELEQAGERLPLVLKAEHRTLDKLVLSKLRAGLGMDRVRLAISGAAPLAPEVLRFIQALNISLVEGYGLTETTAPVSVAPPGKNRIGTVGPPLPEVEVRFDEDGEILVRGPNVFQGYFEDETATREAFDEDGFFRTGDVGKLDEVGYLKITDRKKDLIITAGGKNIAPQEIEGRLKLAPLISQAVVIGDQRPYVTALLTLDTEVADGWARQRGIGAASVAQLANHATVIQEVQAMVNRVNEGLSPVEQIKRWTLLGRDFTQEAEEITPSLKVRRKVITERYCDTIEKMYG
ncbi:MAG: AMP-dependent synthetase/ligase [Actinomycetota bacterium]